MLLIFPSGRLCLVSSSFPVGKTVLDGLVIASLHLPLWMLVRFLLQALVVMFRVLDNLRSRHGRGARDVRRRH